MTTGARAFRTWADGTFEELPVQLTSGVAINASGDVAGYGYADPTRESPKYTASRYSDGAGYVDLGTLSGVWSVATAIGPDGTVVGYYDKGTSDGSFRAFRARPGFPIEDLGLLPDGFYGGIASANGINAAGEIVGSADVPNDTTAAFLYTDADAMVRSLQEDLGCEFAGAKVLILGIGGAGQTAARRLAASGVERLFLVNRTISKAEDVAKEIRQRFPTTVVEIGYPSDRVDLVVNATSVGLIEGDPMPFDPSQFTLGKATAVYDMIYRPAETKLLRAAKAAGCRTATGIGMLLYQGAKALEIWSGRPAPIASMREALFKNIYGNSSTGS
jgi:shikimate dehydrogenase